MEVKTSSQVNGVLIQRREEGVLRFRYGKHKSQPCSQMITNHSTLVFHSTHWVVSWTHTQIRKNVESTCQLVTAD